MAKKWLDTLAWLALMVATAAMGVYWEQFLPTLGVWAGIALIILGIHAYENYTKLELACLILTGGTCIAAGVYHNKIGDFRVINHPNGRKELVTAFYPFGASIASGYRIDTIHASCDYHYYDDEDKTVIAHDNRYVVGDILVQRMFKPSSLGSFEVVYGTDFTFSTHDFGSGELTVLTYRDLNGQSHTVDMFGSDINAPDYHPKETLHKTNDCLNYY